MVSDISTLSSLLAKTVYRREHQKADGRKLFLYGYRPPDEPAVEEFDQGGALGGELRRHPFRQDWAVYASGRQNRTFKPSALQDPLAPSRPGHPPTEIPFSHFELAVFENRFPGFAENVPASSEIAGVDTAPARGACEVVVYAPDSEGDLSTLSQDQRLLLVQTWVDRYQMHFDQGHKFVLPFENRGDEAGVTLHHPHGQIYAFPMIPAVQKQAIESFENGYDLAGNLRLWSSTYQVADAGAMTAFAPPFARFPYEIWIAPWQQRPGPWGFDLEELEGFATLLGDVTRRYDTFFGRPTPYMLSLHAAPPEFEKSFHFTAQFYPLLRSPDRLKYIASVEHATGLYTVDVLPEDSAKVLRDL